MTLVEQFDKLFMEKEVPVDKQLVDGNLVLYKIDYALKPTHTLSVEMIFQTDADKTDIQITFRYVSFAKYYDKRAELLETINQLNEVKTGYFRLYLAGDGEVYLKTLIRANDVLPVYETLVQGPAIVRYVLPELEAINGVFNNVSDFA